MCFLPCRKLLFFWCLIVSHGKRSFRSSFVLVAYRGTTQETPDVSQRVPLLRNSRRRKAMHRPHQPHRTCSFRPSIQHRTCSIGVDTNTNVSASVDATQFCAHNNPQIQHLHTHTHTPRSQRRRVRSTPRHPARKEILGCWCHATQCNAVRCVHAEARLFPFAESVVVVVVAAAGCLLGGGSFFQELRNVLVFFLPGKIEGRFAVVVLDV